VALMGAILLKAIVDGKAGFCGRRFGILITDSSYALPG
jgi:hypothetical protein